MNFEFEMQSFHFPSTTNFETILNDSFSYQVTEPVSLTSCVVSKRHTDNDIEAFDSSFERNGRLLAVPISELLEEVEQQHLRSLVNNSSQASKVNLGIVADDGEDRDEVFSRKDWADFKPTNFSELITNEKINRQVLSWIKKWDSIVFKSKGSLSNSQKVTSKQNGLNVHSWASTPSPVSPSQPQAQGQPKTYSVNQEESKVLLLSGPSGVGKSCLAEVAAAHYGYRILQINSSDDRTSRSLQQMFEDAAYVNNTVFGDRRPCLIILDECDTLSKSAIDTVVKILTRKGKKQFTRPVVAICNNLYSSHMMPLRLISSHFECKTLSLSNVVARLQYICRSQQISISMHALNQLCEKTESDIRSCLNTLQFLSRSSSMISKEDIENVAVGAKDINKSLFSVWNDIFKTQKKASSLAFKSREQKNSDMKYSDQFHVLGRKLSGLDNLDLLIDGLHHNFPNIQFNDPTFERCVGVLDAFCHYDTLDNSLRRDQNWSLHPYTTIAPFFVYCQCAVDVPSKITFPVPAIQARNTFNRSDNLLKTVFFGLPPKMRQRTELRSLLLDVLSFFEHVLSPKIRAVTFSLLSNDDKRLVLELAQALMAYGMTFVQSKDDSGKFHFTISSNVEKLMPSQPVSVCLLPYNVKQMIAREIEIRHLRGNREDNGLQSNASSQITQSQPPLHEPAPAAPVQTKAHAPKTQFHVKRDFFGREICPNGDSKDPSMGTQFNSKQAFSRIGSLMYYRHQEGYTNAVRRKVTVQDFF
eukprot:GCRY01005249.1.p1 GENE.GCRY01005249.1~~GCRY01005249.1.p1  ORF type:complete len:756 (+),score=65.20 GCRY01005249.1:126-2393(+)